MSRNALVILIIAVLVLIAAFALGLLDVDQTKEAKLPDVNVSAEGGQAPAFDVDAKEVVVGTTETNVTVPTVETKETKIDVPVVGVKDDDDDKN